MPLTSLMGALQPTPLLCVPWTPCATIVGAVACKHSYYSIWTDWVQLMLTNTIKFPHTSATSQYTLETTISATLLGQEYLNYLQFVRVHLILVNAPSRVHLILPCLPFSLGPPPLSSVILRREWSGSARTSSWQSCGWQTINTVVLLAYPCTTPKVCHDSDRFVSVHLAKFDVRVRLPWESRTSIVIRCMVVFIWREKKPT